MEEEEWKSRHCVRLVLRQGIYHSLTPTSSLEHYLIVTVAQSHTLLLPWGPRVNCESAQACIGPGRPEKIEGTWESEPPFTLQSCRLELLTPPAVDLRTYITHSQDFIFQ